MAELSMPKLLVSISKVSVEGLKLVILSMFLTLNFVGDDISTMSSPLLEDSLELLLSSEFAPEMMLSTNVLLESSL